jgi:hypothetical protein
MYFILIGATLQEKNFMEEKIKENSDLAPGEDGARAWGNDLRSGAAPINRDPPLAGPAGGPWWAEALESPSKN